MKLHSKRERKRSSISGISFGNRSLDSTICFCASYSELNVWKNTSCLMPLMRDVHLVLQCAGRPDTYPVLSRPDLQVLLQSSTDAVSLLTPVRLRDMGKGTDELESSPIRRARREQCVDLLIAMLGSLLLLVLMRPISNASASDRERSFVPMVPKPRAPLMCAI